MIFRTSSSDKNVFISRKLSGKTPAERAGLITPQEIVSFVTIAFH
jgi:hypothetical protein